jgi:hypothetical protein
MLTGPAACTGVVAVMEVLLTTFTFVASVVSNLTVAVLKFVPVIVTEFSMKRLLSMHGLVKSHIELSRNTDPLRT